MFVLLLVVVELKGERDLSILLQCKKKVMEGGREGGRAREFSMYICIVLRPCSLVLMIARVPVLLLSCRLSLI